VGEFDGTGLNVGLRIPLTSDYRLNLGFTHIEKLPEWKHAYWPGHPGVTLGMDMAVPRAMGKKPAPPTMGPTPPTGLEGQVKLPGTEAYGALPAATDTTLLLADLTVSSLRDSMNMVNSEMRNLMVRLAAMEQRSQFLEDSLKALKLSQNVTERNMNEAMRHLSRSLRYFYCRGLSGGFTGSGSRPGVRSQPGPGLCPTGFDLLQTGGYSTGYHQLELGPAHGSRIR